MLLSRSFTSRRTNRDDDIWMGVDETARQAKGSGMRRMVMILPWPHSRFSDDTYTRTYVRRDRKSFSVSKIDDDEVIASTSCLFFPL